jgi:hypothetical protein
VATSGKVRKFGGIWKNSESLKNIDKIRKIIVGKK